MSTWIIYIIILDLIDPSFAKTAHHDALDYPIIVITCTIYYFVFGLFGFIGFGLWLGVFMIFRSLTL